MRCSMSCAWILHVRNGSRRHGIYVWQSVRACHCRCCNMTSVMLLTELTCRMVLTTMHGVKDPCACGKLVHAMRRCWKGRCGRRWAWAARGSGSALTTPLWSPGILPTWSGTASAASTHPTPATTPPKCRWACHVAACAGSNLPAESGPGSSQGHCLPAQPGCGGRMPLSKSHTHVMQMRRQQTVCLRCLHAYCW